MAMEITEQQAEEYSQRFMDFDPDKATMYLPGDPDVPAHILLMEAVVRRQHYREEAERVVREAVERAREEHYSWHKIGNALGVTGEAVRLRYGHRDQVAS